MGGSRPNIAIVGGGIGGLFAAKALIAQGLRVSVYEQAPALGEVGAGVFLTPNSVRQLQRVGLGPAVEKRGARVGPGSRYFRHDGSPIAPVQVTDSSGARCLPTWFMSDTAVRRLNSTMTQRGFHFQMALLSKPTSSLPRTGFTPNSDLTFFLPRLRSSRGLSPIVAC